MMTTMNNQEIFELLDRFERSSLSTMKVSAAEFSLEVSRNVAAAPAASVPGATAAATSAAIGTAAPAPASELPAITAPLVGTFYAAPAPGEAPFVHVGDTLKKGQTVCLIEAMKMMSEVPAPCDCIVAEVLKGDGELAAFGEALIRYRPC
jgi:acetyl-CoA carboxylase biotin carboxyl carrier protein